VIYSYQEQASTTRSLLFFIKTGVIFMSDLWATPIYIYQWLDDIYHFDLDTCALPHNTKCRTFINAETTDSLKQDWHKLSRVCWMNPPYSDTGTWMKKAYEESQKGCTIVTLIPADTSVNWFHEWVFGKAEVWLLQGRIAFINPDTAKAGAWTSPNFGSIIAIYGPNITSCIKSVKRPPKPSKK
jgi:site-specific DNA-methyltransferase (adenine-specific)